MHLLYRFQLELTNFTRILEELVPRNTFSTKCKNLAKSVLFYLGRLPWLCLVFYVVDGGYVMQNVYFKALANPNSQRHECIFSTKKGTMIF